MIIGNTAAQGRMFTFRLTCSDAQSTQCLLEGRLALRPALATSSMMIVTILRHCDYVTLSPLESGLIVAVLFAPMLSNLSSNLLFGGS